LKIDSVNSNRIWIDDKAPDYVEPDSVSVEDATQQLIAGWSKPADTDILGYSMFKVDNQNTLIDEKNVLNYRFLKSDFDVTTSNNRLAIAGFDSCRNGGVISADHSPVLLSANLSNKYQCDRKLNVSWKEYKGWLFSKHQLIIVDAVTGAKLFDSSFAPGSTNYIWTLPKLGLQMKIWVRAHKQTGSITSTSNRKDLIAYDAGVPSSPTSLYYTSVENEPKIELSCFAQIGDSCVIRYREKSTSVWQLGSSVATSPGNIHWEFIAADAKTKEYEFRLVRFSGCGEPADSSKLSSNILLRKNGSQLQWNAPDHFQNLGISYQYEIQRLELGSWAVTATVTGTNFTPTDLGVSTYRVRAITSNSMPLGKNWSHSNSLLFDGGFDSSLLDTFFIPDAFTPEGVNPIFKVVNQAVLPGQARMLIFNRWGEVIFDGDALEGWNGQVNGEYVSDGVYVYLINARYRSRIVKKTGTLLLIR
jgi:gliding motility-associated-like protein